MGKFLAIFHGAADGESKSELSAEQQSEFMLAWGAWAQANQAALVDPGAPLFMKRVVTSQGVEDFTDTKGRLHHRGGRLTRRGGPDLL